MYTDVVKDHFFNPRNVLWGDDSEWDKKADGVGTVGSGICGDMMKVWIKVDPETDRLSELKWKTFGCASAIASTSMMSVMATENGGMTLEDAYHITPKSIMERLGGLPDRKIHCSVLGDKALRAAINDYFRRTGQEGRIVEKGATVICECLNVTDGDIEEEVLEGVTDFDTLQKRTKVCTGCGTCRPKVEELLAKLVEKYYG
jgi:nitrogen fixation NifU-like protein/NifU-like protein